MVVSIGQTLGRTFVELEGQRLARFARTLERLAGRGVGS